MGRKALGRQTAVRVSHGSAVGVVQMTQAPQQAGGPSHHTEILEVLPQKRCQRIQRPERACHRFCVSICTFVLVKQVN